MKWQIVKCSGTPYEIGYQHGAAARDRVDGSIAFYAKMFLDSSNQTWPQVRETARMFDESIKAKWPDYHSEMQGIAHGSGHKLVDIIALNVRTEIAFGQFTDGCTSLSWKTPDHSLLGQNWDWQEQQKANLIVAYIEQQGKPAIRMVTEAGIIGKIGMNSVGVGVLFNAIRARGLDTNRMPVHLGLRAVLESHSAEEAVQMLKTAGMASSAHMLIGDSNGGIGLEFSSSTFARLNMDTNGRVFHSNHLLANHANIDEPPWLEDSCFRVMRMRELAEEVVVRSKIPSKEDFSALFEDRMNEPGAICRKQEPPITTSASLFNIVMDLKDRTAIIRLGRPCEAEDELNLEFSKL